MNTFFNKYTSLSDLMDKFIDNCVTDDTFYILTNDDIVSILKNNKDKTIDFISKYNFEKGVLLQDSVNNFILQCNEDCSPISKAIEEDNENSENHTSPTDTLKYVQNELFHFLNAPNHLQGKIILGRYEHIGKLDSSRLKELIIVHELREENNYKITEERFLELRVQIQELFPTEDAELFYVPHCRSSTNEKISAQGSLYSTYKFFRKLLREDGILNLTGSDDKKFDSAKKTFIEQVQSRNCLTDQDQDKYSTADILSEWENSQSMRSKLLKPDKKKDIIYVKTYFDSFPCLKFPLGISLLEKDFDNEIKQLIESGNLDNNPKVPYSSLLFQSWMEWVPHIIEFAKNSRIKEVKEFFKKNKDLIDKGTHDSIVALLLLPFLITVPKHIKIKEKEFVTFAKEEISKSFILHVQVPTNLQNERNEFENWMRTNQQELLPYLILCGPLENISQIIVILNNELYLYTDPLKALEACYKCLVALNKWPFMCDYVWHFIQKLIYNIKPAKRYISVAKLIAELQKKKIVINPKKIFNYIKH